jgi:hypothetical protein
LSSRSSTTAQALHVTSSNRSSSPSGEAAGLGNAAPGSDSRSPAGSRV